MIERDLKEEAAGKFPFQTYGPFPLAFDENLSLLAEANEFWDAIDDKHLGLRSAIGVYIFAVQPSKRSALIPWYVGKTERGSFEKRFHAHHALFARLLDRKGKLFVFLIARTHANAKSFMKSRKKLDSIEILETMLIERCLEANRNLYNASKVAHVRGLIVPGFKGKAVGKPKLSAQQLKLMLNKSVPKEF